MRLAKRFRPTIVNATTKENSKKNAKRIADNLAIIKKAEKK